MAMRMRQLMECICARGWKRGREIGRDVSRGTDRYSPENQKVKRV